MNSKKNIVYLDLEKTRKKDIFKSIFQNISIFLLPNPFAEFNFFDKHISQNFPKKNETINIDRQIQRDFLRSASMPTSSSQPKGILKESQKSILSNHSKKSKMISFSPVVQIKND